MRQFINILETHLEELANSEITFTKEQTNSIIGGHGFKYEFQVGDKKYLAIFGGTDHQVKFGFTMEGTDKITGTGNSFQVFSTIRDIFKDFISSNKTFFHLYFEATPSEPSRIKLYKAIAQSLPKWVPELKLKKIDDEPWDDPVSFWFIRPRS